MVTVLPEICTASESLEALSPERVMWALVSSSYPISRSRSVNISDALVVAVVCAVWVWAVWEDASAVSAVPAQPHRERANRAARARERPAVFFMDMTIPFRCAPRHQNG